MNRTSFGGGIAGLFTTVYPELIESLIAICPAMKTPIVTELSKRLMNGDYGALIPEDATQFTHLIELLTCQKVPFPRIIMQSLLEASYPEKKKVFLRKRKKLFIYKKQ